MGAKKMRRLKCRSRGSQSDRQSNSDVWGRGTNRVIDECRAWGIEAPTFKADMGVTTVTFKAEILPGGDIQEPSLGTKSWPPCSRLACWR